MRKRWKLAVRSGGCFFVFLTAIFACAMVLVNALFLSSFYIPVETIATETIGDAKFGQGVARGVLYLGPVFMLVLQWWVLDLIVDLFSSERRLKDTAD